MSFHLLYHPDVKKEDIRDIPQNIKKRIRMAIEDRIMTDPEKYGQPLKRGLQGYRKLRVGDYRIIYKIKGAEVLIFKIGHRKAVYTKAVFRKNS